MAKNSISRSFIEVFEPTMFSKGFKRKGKVFHRIVNNQVLQLLSYYKYMGASQLTIDFSILPLCYGFELYSSFEGARLSSEFREYVRDWDYDNIGADGYIEYMPVALKATEELLFPKLDKEIDYKSCYESFKNKPTNSRLRKMSFATYIYNLIFEKYEETEAREDYFQYWREMNIENFDSEHHMSSELQEKFEEERQVYYKIKESLAKGDKKPAKDYITALEKKSLDSYVKIYSTPKRYEKYLEDGILPFEVVNISHTSNSDFDKNYQEMLLKRKTILSEERERERELEASRMANLSPADKEFIRKSDILFEKLKEIWSAPEDTETR